MKPTLRTKKTYLKYKKFREDGHLANGCNLCKKLKVIKEFKYWRIVKNEFPWDLIAKKNDMLIPKRHVVYQKLNKAEKKEFDRIKLTYINSRYHLTAEATDRIKSIPSHFHIHLLVLKNNSYQK